MPIQARNAPHGTRRARFTPGRLLAFAACAGITVCSVVQDRATAEGARRYVAIQRAAMASGSGSAISIDDVMRPAVRRAVREGVLWGGGAAAVGCIAAAVVRRNHRG